MELQHFNLTTLSLVLVTTFCFSAAYATLTQDQALDEKSQVKDVNGVSLKGIGVDYNATSNDKNCMELHQNTMSCPFLKNTRVKDLEDKKEFTLVLGGTFHNRGNTWSTKSGSFVETNTGRSFPGIVTNQGATFTVTFKIRRDLHSMNSDKIGDVTVVYEDVEEQQNEKWCQLSRD